MPQDKSFQVVERMNQMTFSDMEYSRQEKETQKDKFLRSIEGIIPWADWVEKIRPYYPEGKRGRPHRGIEGMSFILQAVPRQYAV